MKGAVYSCILTNPRTDEEIRTEWKNINDTIKELKKNIDTLFPELDFPINKNTIYNLTKKNNQSVHRILKNVLNVKIERESIKNINLDYISLP